ncbi:unnamed protein product, partial [Meganyctiphanes norvegica]
MDAGDDVRGTFPYTITMKSPPLEGGEGPCEIMHDKGLCYISIQVGGKWGGVITGHEGAGMGRPPAEADALTALQGDLVPHTNFTHTFLKSILTSIDSKDPVVANAWLETLLDVMDLLPKEVIKEEILVLAVNKGQSQQVSARLAACKLIGKIATKFEPFLLKTEVVGVVQSLCQDVCGEVRGSMCSQLAAVARGLGLDATKTHILPELVDLCSDEETNVRLAGINTVVHMIPLLDDETRVGTLVPLVRKVCERALRVEDASLPVTAHLLGRICHGLHDDLTEEQKSWFLNFYCTLSKLGLPDSKKTELPMPDLVCEVRSGEYEAECRQQCAYNLPGMIVFAGGSTHYRTTLHSTLSSFVTDPSLQVCTTISRAYHQLCTLVGGEVGQLREGLLQLLRSQSLEVLAALLPNLPHIVSAMNRHNVLTPHSPKSEVLELVRAVKAGEETVSTSSSWRINAEALNQMAALAPVVPADVLFSELVPLVIIRMHTARPIPCRMAAARTLLIFLKHMEDKEQRDHVCKTIVTEFCEGSSCHKRMLFLSICHMVLELFPKSYFKCFFFRPLLKLHGDRVVNIRLKLVGMLPAMKSTLSLPEDKTKLQELETVVGSLLMSEADRDVSAAISQTITQLDKIEVTETQRLPPEGEAGDKKTIEGDVSDRHTYNNNNNDTSNRNKLDKKSPDGGLGDRRSIARSSNRRSSGGLSRLPSYLTSERRRSGSHAPKNPPDERTLLRMSTLDPSTDEFLVDAGIRIDESQIKNHQSRLPAPQISASTSRLNRWNNQERHSSYSNSNNRSSSTDSGLDKQGRGGSRLKQPMTVTGSRIPAPGSVNRSSNSTKEDHDSSSSVQSSGRRGAATGNVVTRLRPPTRSPRPVSTTASSSARGLVPSRAKSLSHENLRTSPSRLALPSSPGVSPNSSRSTSPNSSPQDGEGRPRTLAVTGSRLRQPQVRSSRASRSSRPTSCSSSPGGSRCSSPGVENQLGLSYGVRGSGGSRGNSRTGSASSSPASSRCSSPGQDDLRPLTRGGQLRASAPASRTGSALSRAGRRGQSLPEEAPVTPPSPGPSPRSGRQGSSGIPAPRVRGTPGTPGTPGSKLPLPTSTKT